MSKETTLIVSLLKNYEEAPLTFSKMENIFRKQNLFMTFMTYD